MKTKFLIIIVIIITVFLLVTVVYPTMNYRTWGNNELSYTPFEPGTKIVCDEWLWQPPQNCRTVYIITDTEPENALILDKYENMSCNEIAIKVYDEKINIDSKEERTIVKEKLRDCNRLISGTLDYSECSSIRIIANSPLTFHVPDNLLHLESKIYSCIKNNEFELDDVSLTHQISICNDETKDEEFFINACKDVQVISQPFKHSMSFEELYPEIVENEQKIIHDMDCSDVRNTYDGKMHLVGWDVHREIISDKLKECKS